MRRVERFLAVGVLAILGTAGACGDPPMRGLIPPPKTTIEPDGESYKWSDDEKDPTKGPASAGKINARFVNRKIDRLRACDTQINCPVQNDRTCTRAVVTREHLNSTKTEITMETRPCHGSSGHLCIDWTLTQGGVPALLGPRAAGGTRDLPIEFFFDAATDKTSYFTCDGVPVKFVEIDWK